jgi:hypothetical protein
MCFPQQLMMNATLVKIRAKIDVAKKKSKAISRLTTVKFIQKLMLVLQLNLSYKNQNL